MRYSVLTAALTGTCVLCMMGCGTQRSVRSDVRSLTLLETRDTVHEQVMVAVHDTLMITKTITIRENEAGDTIRMTTIMDRERVRSMADVRSKKEEARVVVDSIYIERNDSIRTQNARFADREENRSSSLVSVLKWLLAMMVVLSMLIVIVRLKV